MPRFLVASAVLVVVTGCGPRLVRAPHSMPAGVSLTVSPFGRIWVAGFLASAKELDANLETVRLLRSEIRARSSVPVVDAEPLVIDSERRFCDVPYWRHLGEEHGSPLIVTGSVSLILAPPEVVQRGIRTAYIPTAGRVLNATVILIDGHTGVIGRTQKLPTQMKYGIGRFSSGLALYFQMMDRAMPDWFKAISMPQATEQRCAS